MSKDSEEMKRYIQNWITSKKYLDIKKDLKERAEAIVNLTKDELVEHVQTFGKTREELIKITQDIIDYDKLDDEEKDDISWINQSILELGMTSKDDLYKDFVKNMISWHTYMLIYQNKEEYEICSLLLKVIKIETKEFVYMLKLNFEFEADDEIMIAEIEDHIKQKILLSNDGQNNR
jgi:hypothetical protein